MDTLSSGFTASAQRSVPSLTLEDAAVSDTSHSQAPSQTKPAAGARRNRVLAPPPAQYVSEPAAEEHAVPTQASGPLSSRGRMLYTFQASNVGELSVSEDDDVNIAEADDGSGWTSVQYGGNVGLVPTSYLEILPEPPPKLTLNAERPISSYSSSTTSLTGSMQSSNPSAPPVSSSFLGKKKGPAVAPKRGAKKLKFVEAMYDYDSRSDAEWSMTEGEKFVCVNRDTGDGWADVERGGVVKSVPANYVKDV